MKKKSTEILHIIPFTINRIQASVKREKVGDFILFLSETARKNSENAFMNACRVFILFFVFILLNLLFIPAMAGVFAGSNDSTPARNNAPVVIKVSGDHAYPPYEFLEDGLPSGFNIELIKAVAEVMGIQAEVKLMPWDDVRQRLEDGRTDVLAGMYYSEERAKTFSFSVPHTIVSSGIFIRKGSSIRGLGDLKDCQVLVQEGDIMHDYLLSSKITSKIITVRDPVEALRLLSKGNYDAALLSSRIQGMFFVSRLGLDNLASLETGLPARKYCFATAKENEHLLHQLNEGLAIVKASSRYREIHDKWFGVYEEPDYWKKALLYLLPILFILIVLIITGFVWSWLLKRTVKERTRELTVSRQNLSTLFQESPAVIMIISRDENLIMEVNDAFVNISGITRDEAIGRKPDDLSLFLSPIIPSELLTIRGDQKTVRNVELKMRNKTGDPSVCLMSAALIEFEGKPGFLCHMSDITDRKRMEEALRESEEWQSATLHSIGDGVIACDNEGRVKSLNRMAEEMTGWKSEEAAGKNIEEIFNIINAITREKTEIPVRSVLTSGQIVGLANHTVLIARNGRELHIADSCAPISDSEGNTIGAVLVFRDVTGEYQRREELLRKNKELLDFAYTVSHDLKSPLFILTEFLTAISNDPSLFNEYYEKVIRQANKMHSFIDNLLKLSKAGQLTGEAGSFQLETLFRKVYKANKSAEIPSELVVHSTDTGFEGDSDKFEQLFANLISNSVRYRDPLKEKVVIEFDCRKDNDGVLLSIKDNGLGIECNELSKIFNMGYTSDKNKGNGFGLAIVRKIVDAYSGSIRAESEGKGKGTCFFIHFRES